MTNSLILVLYISLIGMSLVFLLIVILWGFMAMLTRLFVDHEKNGALQQDDKEDKYKAAILAISMALANDSIGKPHEFPLPPTALVSAWQAVMRSNIITKRGRIR